MSTISNRVGEDYGLAFSGCTGGKLKMLEGDGGERLTQKTTQSRYLAQCCSKGAWRERCSCCAVGVGGSGWNINTLLGTGRSFRF